MKFEQLAEALNPYLSQKDADVIYREIETGRGGIAELVRKKPVLTQMSRDALRVKYGETVEVYRAVAVLDEGLRADTVASVTPNFAVAWEIAEGFPVLMGKDRFISSQPALLAYRIEIDRVLAHVPTLVGLAKTNVPSSRKTIRGRSGPVSIDLIRETGIKEEEIIADLSNLSPRVFQTPAGVIGRHRLHILWDVYRGLYRTPEECLKTMGSSFRPDPEWLAQTFREVGEFLGK